MKSPSPCVLLRNPVCLTLDPPRVDECDIRVADGTIVERGRRLKARSEDSVIDLTGKYVMPGLVCCHTHLYSALSRGMPPPRSMPRNFLDILRNVWWKLDESLDEGAIRASALAGAIEAVKAGTTTIVDHHSSPNCIRGSLDMIKEELSRVGVRGILCYETTDRGGIRRRDQGLEENRRFAAANAGDARFRGLIGAHASFTLADDSLRRLGELASNSRCGVHIHVAEDSSDVTDCKSSHKIGLVERLERFGVLRGGSVFAHGVHLSAGEFERVDDAGAWMIHNPRSNMNNRVGYAPIHKFGRRSALGTDGFPADMFEETRFAYFRNAESEFKTELARFPFLARNGQRMISELFGNSFGTLEPGGIADLLVLGYSSPTPLTSHNLNSHFIFGMNSAAVEHVMVNGQWVVWNRRLTTVDEDAERRKAATMAKRLWRRMQ